MIQFTDKKYPREDVSTESARVLRVKKYAQFLTEIVMDARKDRLHNFAHYIERNNLKCLRADAINPTLAEWSTRGISTISSTDVIKAAEKLADTHNARGARFIK